MLSIECEDYQNDYAIKDSEILHNGYVSNFVKANFEKTEKAYVFKDNNMDKNDYSYNEFFKMKQMNGLELKI